MKNILSSVTLLVCMLASLHCSSVTALIAAVPSTPPSSSSSGSLLLKQPITTSFSYVNTPAKRTAMEASAFRHNDDVAEKVPSLQHDEQQKRSGVMQRLIVGTTPLVLAAAVPPLSVLAEVNEYGEDIIPKADLPPVWIPVVFAMILFGGIGWLQFSLGDVMDEEARLGNLSGARAGRQSARDRDMFKKTRKGEDN